MSRLPALNARIVIQILISNGFILDRISGSHHIYFNFITKRRVTVPVHTRTLPKGTLFSIIRQAGLTREDFK